MYVYIKKCYFVSTLLVIVKNFLESHHKHMKLSRVAIHGVPRSGTSWIGEIVNSSPNIVYRYQPLFSYAHKNFLSESSCIEDIDNFFNNIAACNDEFTNQINKRNNGDFPLFAKEKITHIAYKEVRYMNILFNLMDKDNDIRLCAVIRNPLSVINSWLKAPREFRKDLGWNEMEEWRYAFKKNLNRPEEYHGYEKWKEAANIFLELKKKYQERVYILKYTDIIRNPLKETSNLFRFIGVDLNNQTINFLHESTNSCKSDSYAVFRKNQDDNKWKYELNSNIAYDIKQDLNGTELEIFVKD